MSQKVVVIGAGIGGLTAGALLAKRGYEVVVVEQAAVPGGCASTFERRGFTFDVGATQVAGLEPGGIHARIFGELGVEPPAARPCDPACAVFLPGEQDPISVWRDRTRWQVERQRHFPHSEPFWQLMATLFEASWRFQGRDPILPPRNSWDLGQLIGALRPDTLITLPFALMTVGDALRLYGLGQDQRLRTFLDLQLKLYSQVNAEETALLYAATALGVSQEPQGLYHLEGSMQGLSDRLVQALERHNGQLLLRHTVQQIHTKGGKASAVTLRQGKTGAICSLEADNIVANVTVHNLLQLLPDVTPAPPSTLWENPLALLGLNPYRQRVARLPNPSGAFVVYLGVKQAAIPEGCPPHLQFLYDYEGEIGENNSLFVSVSQPDDGRAPQGCATVIASSFVDTRPWWGEERAAYQRRKAEYLQDAIARLSQYFHLTPDTIIHQEAATPRTFARYTAREAGFVGGVGQRRFTFGPFGFATRTPIPHLWLVGDSNHPGEGTAGVSYSALTVVRQIEQQN
ncbi:C-3',4' desaturase CrtD [Spirulina subsalsa FACHB-351]|uniref:C-3',4' desaturase CrtD n=1 Tax=Spirulina subsalsa FACHB-351 TaxID=234711 RepID=A0ABT3LB30_9CYAN|nr:C-3',4' desaturase CrtD [Spirulina subsalsa]MCW6038723.1 C-3',4' desaturase CrtD [Spirulina subsalsa FACHB-351]